MAKNNLDIFISSQIEEFEKFREYIERKINSKKFLECTLLEKRGAMPYTTLRSSLNKVRRSDILIGLIGKNESSITREEIKEALEKDIPCFFYIKKTKNRALEMTELIEEYIQPYGKYKKFSSIWKICKQIMDDLDDFLIELLRTGIEEHKNIREQTQKKEKAYRELKTSSKSKLPHLILVNQAKESFEQNDYLTAIIKIGISMEMWLKQLLLNENMSMSAMSKRPMGWFIATAKKWDILEPNIIHDLLEISHLRNNAVHMNKLPTKKDAEFAIKTVNTIIEHYESKEI